MTERYGKLLRNAIWIGLLLLVAFPIQFTRYTDLAAEPATVLWTVRNAIQVTLMLAWGVSLKRRIMNKTVRRMLIAVAALLTFWLIVRLCKWEYTLGEMDTLGRYCWYGFYIPMVMVPLLGVFIVDHIGKAEHYHCPRWMMLLYIPGVLLILGVFTNDWHRLAFEFPKGIEYYNRHYTYGVVYYLVMAWFVALGFYFVVMLLRKCRVPGSKSFQKLPLVIMILAVVFWTVYCLGVRECDLTAIDCFIITMLLESAIQGGLIQANSGYDALFRMSAYPIQIIDHKGNICYCTENSTVPAASDILQARVAPVHKGDTVLYCQSIRGGFVLWQDNVEQINEATEKLAKRREELSRSNQLLAAELELQANRAKAEEMMRLYDQVNRDVMTQMTKVAELLQQAKSGVCDSRYALSKVCVLSAYIKRRGNLVFLQNQSSVPLRELEYCLRESLDNLRLYGTYTSMEANVSGEVPLQYICEVYDWFELVLEQCLDHITAVLVHLSGDNGALRLRLQIGCDGLVPESLSAAVPVQTAQVSCQIEDEDVIWNLCMSKGGDA